jgi:integrase
MANLTKTAVDAAKPVQGKAQHFLWDDKLPGFGLRITHGGVKSYIIEYRPKGSTQSRRYTIGRHGKITAEQARKIAETLFADITHGGDPARKEQAAKAEITVSQLLDQFLVEHVALNNKATTAHEERRLIEKKIKPALGKLRLSDLTRPRVRSWHSGLSGTKVSANRALAHLQRACRFAMEHGLLADNPCSAITRHKEAARDRYFTDEELGQVGSALTSMEQSGAITANAADGIRLLAFTGLRISEVRNLRWEDFDRQTEVVRLRDSKTGARSVRLSNQAFDLLSAMERQGEHIISGSDPSQPMRSRSFARAIETVIRQAGVKDASAHTFRHTLATYMAQHGDSAPLIAAMGGWKTLGMVQRYVNLHGAGKTHAMAAGQRIAIGLAVGTGNVVHVLETA